MFGLVSRDLVDLCYKKKVKDGNMIKGGLSEEKSIFGILLEDIMKF